MSHGKIKSFTVLSRDHTLRPIFLTKYYLWLFDGASTVDPSCLSYYTLINLNKRKHSRGSKCHEMLLAPTSEEISCNQRGEWVHGHNRHRIGSILPIVQRHRCSHAECKQLGKYSYQKSSSKSGCEGHENEVRRKRQTSSWHLPDYLSHLLLLLLHLI